MSEALDHVQREMQLCQQVTDQRCDSGTSRREMFERVASSQVDVQQCSNPRVQAWEAATDGATFRVACVGRVEGGRNSSHDCVDRGDD